VGDRQEGDFSDALIQTDGDVIALPETSRDERGRKNEWKSGYNLLRGKLVY
jgi:hypothetical protein